MGGIPLDPQDLVKKLGPNFDYGAISRIKSQPAVWNALPQQVRDAFDGLGKLGVDLNRVSNPAPRDRIGEGAFPTPPMPKSTADPGSYADQLQGLIENIPLFGPLSAMSVAYTNHVRFGIPFEQALGTEQARQATTAQEFLHQITVGIAPSPQVSAGQQEAFNTITKPATALLAMGLQGVAVVRALGLVSKAPQAMTLLEQIPERMRDVGMGATTLGILDGLRADGIPKDPSILDPSGKVAKSLADKGVPERLALFAGGSFVGGFLGGSILGISRGIEWSRNIRMMNSITPAQLEAMQKALASTGITLDAGTSKSKTVELFIKSMKKVLNDEDLAGMVSENLSREEWIAQQVYGSANIALPLDEESRYLTGLLRGQPGQVSVATNISDPVKVQAAAEKLGLQVDVVSVNRAKEGEAPMYHVLINRPDYTYTSFDQTSRLTKRATKLVGDLASNLKRDLFAKQTNDIFILADGSTVRGGFTTDELVNKLRPQAPVVGGVARPDLGAKRLAQMVNVAITEDNKMVIELPHTLTQEQFNQIGPAVNVHRFEQVLVKTTDGSSKVLDNPIGQQVQDAVAKLIKPKSQLSRLTPELVGQYKRSGVFDGQAAVLADGSPVTIQKKAGFLYVAKDPLTGEAFTVHPSKITILPTSLEGEMAPSSLFYQYLSTEERQAFAKFRLGMQAGLTAPLEKFKDLEQFANSRGMFLGRGSKRGTFEIQRAVDGEIMQFSDKNAAIEYIRKNSAPMPDLTPDIVKQVLGGNPNFGFSLGGASPLKPGEIIPIPPNFVKEALEANLAGRGPGALELFMKPTRALALDFDKRFGTQFFPLFDNVQSRMVFRQNFEARWYDGRGEALPSGVLPLQKIEKMAGPHANRELITEWLEAPKAEKAAVEAKMTAGEKMAGRELRKWYDGLFPEFGIEADYLENFAPRIRQLAPKFGNNPNALMKAGLMDDILQPTSKGLEFFSDNYRSGALDVYEEDAFRGAMRYLTQGAGNRFMKEPVAQMAQYVSQMAQVNRSVAYPMGYFLQAVKGTEFSEQRLAMSESMQRLIESLPGAVPAKNVTSTADQLTAYWMASVYSGTMGFRPGLALRNVANSMMMSWPMFGGNKGRYLEAMSMALTRPGVDAAIADGAIALKQGPRFGTEEISDLISPTFNKLTEYGFAMYDSADQYTRAHVYWAARLQSEDAIARFAKGAEGASPERIAKLKANLLAESGMIMQDKQIADEFIRRMLISPESASRYAGKQASDVVNFLYGRGMQPRWMRGMQGRLLGQFGTWPLWYIDYLRRTTTNLAANGGAGAAAKFLARHALVNASVAYAGHKALDVDLGRWMVYPAVFYSGGPGFQAAVGLFTLARGLSAVAEGASDPYGPTRVDAGLQMISQSLPAMVPFWFGARDAVRFATADDPVEKLASVLATKADAQHVADRKLRMLLGDPEPFSSSSDVLTEMLNRSAAGQPMGEDPYRIRDLPSVQKVLGGTPMLQPPPNVQGTAPPPQAPPTVPSPQGGLSPVQIPSTRPKQIPGEVTTPAESRPPQTY